MQAIEEEIFQQTRRRGGEGRAQDDEHGQGEYCKLKHGYNTTNIHAGTHASDRKIYISVLHVSRSEYVRAG